MAEMPFGPVAPAILAAVHDATGIWVDELPLTPEAMRTILESRSENQAR
jgi:CO/xanthine dehydrogenase Mo-binding subunit